MKVFLSHSSKDREIAIALRLLIEDCCDDAAVFCSSDDGAIPVGKDFTNLIYRHLDESDVFIPLLSVNYYKSKYCMIELGTAIGNLYQRNGIVGGDYIYPFCVYPVKPGNALKGTPISNKHAADLRDSNQVHYFIRNGIKTRNSINGKVEDFIHKVNSIIIQKDSILEYASTVRSYAAGDKVYVKEWKDFSNASAALDCNTITTAFNLNPYERKKFIKPDFISTVVHYVDGIDLNKYLLIRPNAEFKFSVNNFTNSLKSISVELKHGFGNNKTTLFDPVRFELVKGKNECSFALDKFECNKLEKISEICFVVDKNSFIEDEGSYIIENMRIE